MSITSNEQIRVAAKRIPGLSDLTLKVKDAGTEVTAYSGLLFDIWNEIARANNYRYIWLLIIGVSQPLIIIV